MRKTLLVACVVLSFGFGTGAVYAGDENLPAPAFDVELRGGGGLVCGYCAVLKGEDKPWEAGPNFQLFADYLVPVKKIGSGFFEIGPYAKFSLLGDRGRQVPQIAGGVAIAYKWESLELLLHGGLAYATDRLGEGVAANTKDWSGQSRANYDLGLEMRWFFENDWFLSAGIGHNSNGNDIGLNFTGDSSNPSYDYFFFGIGKRF